MRIFNWIKSRKSNSFTLEVKKLEIYFALLKSSIEYIIDTQVDIEKKVEQLENRTKQHLKKEQLVNELWILRYTTLHICFFELKTAKNQVDVSENLALINRAFETVLENNGKADYLTWLKKGFIEYEGMNTLTFNNLKKFKSNFFEKVSEKIPSIAYECTDGRFAGELHDTVIKILMTTIAQDKKFFELDTQTLSNKEFEDIKEVIEGLERNRKKAGNEFFKSLLGEEI